MKKKNLKQNQAHGKPNKANPPTDSQKKKTPNTDSVPKRQNQTKTPIVVVTVAKLAHRRR